MYITKDNWNKLFNGEKHINLCDMSKDGSTKLLIHAEHFKKALRSITNSALLYAKIKEEINLDETRLAISEVAEDDVFKYLEGRYGIPKNLVRNVDACNVICNYVLLKIEDMKNNESKIVA